MKDYDYYAMKGANYPTKTQFTTVYAYKAGKLLWQGAVAEFDEYKNSLERGAIIEKSVDESAYGAAAKAYHSEKTKRHHEFFNDLCYEHGVTGHPKADRVYELAHDQCHFDNYEEIARHFSNLVELIKD